MTDDDPIHNHPTVQTLLAHAETSARNHRRLIIVAVVIGLTCLSLAGRLAYDDTVGYDRPAVLQ